MKESLHEWINEKKNCWSKKHLFLKHPVPKFGFPFVKRIYSVSLLCNSSLHAQFPSVIVAYIFGIRSFHHFGTTNVCLFVISAFDYKYQNALRQAIIFGIFFSFVKNRWCVTQMFITKIAAKCILVVLVKWRHHANVLLVQQIWSFLDPVQVSKGHQFALEVMTYVGCGLTMIGTVLSLAVLVKWT